MMNAMTSRVGLLLVVVMLVGCKAKDGVPPEEAAPAPKAVEQKAATVPSTLAESGTAPKAVEQPVAPAPAEPRPLADPGCEKDCKSIGYCVRDGGGCAVGEAEHCRQSDNCRISGACSTKEMYDDDGTPFLTCTAATDEDCKGAETCQEKGNCKAADGHCMNPTSPEQVVARASTVSNIAKLLNDLSAACEKDKAATVKQLRASGLGELAPMAWEDPFKPGLLNSEGRGFVRGVMAGVIKSWMILDKLMESNKDLLGVECFSILNKATVKAMTGCLKSGERQDLAWIKSLDLSKCNGGGVTKLQGHTGAVANILHGGSAGKAGLSDKLAVAMSGAGTEFVLGHGSGGMGLKGTGSDEAVITNFVATHKSAGKLRGQCSAEGESSVGCMLLGKQMYVMGGNQDMRRVGLQLVKKCCDQGKQDCCDSYEKMK